MTPTTATAPAASTPQTSPSTPDSMTASPGPSSEPPSATRARRPGRGLDPRADRRTPRRPGDRIVGPWYGEDWRTARPIAPYHKGDGHVTDDTLMTHALIRVYEKVRDHLDAYAVADHLVPDLLSPRWIPELEAEALLQRIFLAEKWIVARLHYGHVDPREAGAGNIVSCGAAMYMAPVGLVNAGHPEAAYAEALEVAAPHQSSYGREAAGVFAARRRRRLPPGRDPDAVVDAALALAKDGTRSAIEEVCEVASHHDDFESALAPMRAAVEPFDTVGPDYRSPALGARRPSRLHAIEELPVALGMLLVGGGDYRRTVLGSVNYGRDCDSIATMSGAMAGALGGGIPADWAETVAEASRLDLHTPARALAQVAREVFARDLERRAAHEEAFTALAGER